jgi:hypothetical protein
VDKPFVEIESKKYNYIKLVPLTKSLRNSLNTKPGFWATTIDSNGFGLLRDWRNRWVCGRWGIRVELAALPVAAFALLDVFHDNYYLTQSESLLYRYVTDIRRVYHLET